MYDLVLKKGEDIKGYIGQSKNLVTRIRRHFGKKGKLKEFVKIGDEILYKMPGSTKKQREIYEQYVMLKKYKKRWKELGELLNKRNPVGGRYNLDDPIDLKRFYKDAEEIIEHWKLPKEFPEINF